MVGCGRGRTLAVYVNTIFVFPWKGPQDRERFHFFSGMGGGHTTIGTRDPTLSFCDYPATNVGQLQHRHFCASLGNHIQSVGRLIHLRKVAGTCNSRIVVPPLSLSVRSNRFLALLNPSNYKGAALLHVLTKLSAPAGKGVVLSKRSVAGLPPCGQSIGVMFRGCTLFPRVATRRGVNFNLHVGNINGRRTTGHARGLLGLVQLRSLHDQCPSRVSKKRRRHITITHTLMGGPGVLLLSRPLNTLSCRLHGALRVRLGSLRRRLNLAFMFIARSRRRTLAVDSHVIVVSGKRVRRSSSPGAVCRCPGAGFITNFVKRDGFFSGKGRVLILHPRGLGLYNKGSYSSSRPTPHFFNAIRSIVFCNAVSGMFVHLSNANRRILTCRCFSSIRH